MPINPRNDQRLWCILICLIAFALALPGYAENLALQLKNGDRVSGTLLSETNKIITLSSPVFGKVQVPLDQISKREILPPPPSAAETSTNAAATIPGTNATAQAEAPKLEAKPKKALSPANPEAAPIATHPTYWKHDIQFGLNLRYAEIDSQEFDVIEKSAYGNPPWRHIFDVAFKYGHTAGSLSANSLAGSEKSEYDLSRKTYLFNLVGGGYDEIREVDLQYEFGPGIGRELVHSTNFVWKTEGGFNFEQQYLSDHSELTSYSVRIAEIFAWRIWENLTADAKFEFFPNLGQLGQYRFRIDSTLRYPISKHLSLNLNVIDLYDTQAAQGIDPNDLQIRSTIGVTF